MHIKTGLVAGSLFVAMVLTGCASSTSSTAYLIKATVTATATPSPSPTVVALSTGSSGEARAAKQAALTARQTVLAAKQAGAKKIVAAAPSRVNRQAPASYTLRIPRYMLDAANSQ